MPRTVRKWCQLWLACSLNKSCSAKASFSYYVCKIFNGLYLNSSCTLCTHMSIAMFTAMPRFRLQPHKMTTNFTFSKRFYWNITPDIVSTFDTWNPKTSPCSMPVCVRIIKHVVRNRALHRLTIAILYVRDYFDTVVNWRDLSDRLWQLLIPFNAKIPSFSPRSIPIRILMSRFNYNLWYWPAVENHSVFGQSAFVIVVVFPLNGLY